jgi:lambda family phage minor tail protein L
MKEFDDTFIQEKNKQIVKPIRLYTLYDYDNAGANLYMAEYNANVRFPDHTGGQVYSKFPIQFQSVSEKTGGEVDEVKLVLSNVSQEIESLLQNPAYKFKGKKVTITYVFADQLADADCKYEETFYIDYYESDAHNAVFTLSSKLDVYSVMLPGRTVIRTHCSWIFKGIECKYADGESTCNRTLQRCRALGNTLNYGGFPAAGGRRMFV